MRTEDPRATRFGAGGFTISEQECAKWKGFFFKEKICMVNGILGYPARGRCFRKGNMEKIGRVLFLAPAPAQLRPMEVLPQTSVEVGLGP